MVVEGLCAHHPDSSSQLQQGRLPSWDLFPLSPLLFCLLSSWFPPRCAGLLNPPGGRTLAFTLANALAPPFAFALGFAFGAMATTNGASSTHGLCRGESALCSSFPSVPQRAASVEARRVYQGVALQAQPAGLTSSYLLPTLQSVCPHSLGLAKCQVSKGPGLLHAKESILS